MSNHILFVSQTFSCKISLTYRKAGPPVYKSGQVAALAEDAPVSNAQPTTTRKAVASAPKTTLASVPKTTSIPASASVPKTTSTTASASRRPWRQVCQDRFK